MLRQRTVIFLPSYFQAVRGASTLQSGLMYLPLAVAMAITALAEGSLMSFIGYYSPVLMLGSVFAAVAVGLKGTLTPNTDSGEWILYQIVYGIGIGMASRPPSIDVETVLNGSTAPTGLALLNLTLIFGGMVILSIVQNMFLNRLSRNLAIEVPGLDPDLALSNGATDLVQAVSAQFRDRVLGAYDGVLKDVFGIA
ncbi:MAG: hypothetical protein Q9191_003332 [Dirinaria sp. TL-2023a]